MEVKIPDPKEQWKKTPGWRLVYETFLDPMTGEEIEISRRRPWFEQIGEETVMLKWDDIRKKFLLAGKHKKEDLKRRLEYAGGKWKRDTKKGVLAGVIELYIGRKVTDEELDTKAIEEFEKELDDWFVRAGRWGLGCPAGCRRFWEFKPTDDLSHFVPVDSQAWNAPVLDKEGNVIHTRGYLDWRPQVDGTIKFTCDNCGGEVILA